MDANKAMKKILITAKPMLVTDKNKERFIEDCKKSGIILDNNLNVKGNVTEENINKLVNNLSTAVLKLVIRRVLRSL